MASVARASSPISSEDLRFNGSRVRSPPATPHSTEARDRPLVIARMNGLTMIAMLSAAVLATAPCARGLRVHSQGVRTTFVRSGCWYRDRPPQVSMGTPAGPSGWSGCRWSLFSAGGLMDWVQKRPPSAALHPRLPLGGCSSRRGEVATTCPGEIADPQWPCQRSRGIGRNWPGALTAGVRGSRWQRGLWRCRLRPGRCRSRQQCGKSLAGGVELERIVAVCWSDIITMRLEGGLVGEAGLDLGRVRARGWSGPSHAAMSACTLPA